MDKIDQIKKILITESAKKFRYGIVRVKDAKGYMEYMRISCMYTNNTTVTLDISKDYTKIYTIYTPIREEIIKPLLSLVYTEEKVDEKSLKIYKEYQSSYDVGIVTTDLIHKLEISPIDYVPFWECDTLINVCNEENTLEDVSILLKEDLDIGLLTREAFLITYIQNREEYTKGKLQGVTKVEKIHLCITKKGVPDETKKEYMLRREEKDNIVIKNELKLYLPIDSWGNIIAKEKNKEYKDKLWLFDRLVEYKVKQDDKIKLSVYIVNKYS